VREASHHTISIDCFHRGNDVCTFGWKRKLHSIGWEYYKVVVVVVVVVKAGCGVLVL